ncbi:MAG: hypothetical protein EPO24_11435 [Bacteroidetes bacterium]|nr:MAG: hypothetical protein EPO24_11435 [Bacteroidota bacterium]
MQHMRYVQDIRALIFFLVLTSLTGCDTTQPVNKEEYPTWIVINTSNGHLLHNKINDLTVDIEDKIWIATDSGANAFNKGLWLSFTDSLSYIVYPPPPEKPMKAHIVNSIAATGNILWFALKGGGLIWYNKFSEGKIWRRYTENNGLLFNYINWVASDLPHKELWAASQYGVNRYVPSTTTPDDGIWLTYTKNNSLLPTNNIKVIEVNPVDNSIWFGTFDKGLVSFDRDKTWNHYPIPPPYDEHITSIAFDANSKVWVGRGTNSDGGISLLDVPTGTWIHYTMRERTNGVLPRRRVNAIVTNMRGTRWFGTDNGLVLLKDTTWSIVRKSSTPELPSDTIRALLYDRYENLWIGTDKGIAVYNPEGAKIK